MMTQAEFCAAFKGSPIKRAKLRGLKRDAAVVLGNDGAPAAVPALTAALSDDEPLAREHAAWALGKIGSPEPGPPALRRSCEALGLRCNAAFRRPAPAVILCRRTQHWIIHYCVITQQY